MTGVLVGESESDVRDRARELLQTMGENGGDPDGWLAERRNRWILGTPDQARARAAEFEAAGAQRMMLQTFLPRDLDMVRVLARIFLDQGGPG